MNEVLGYLDFGKAKFLVSIDDKLLQGFKLKHKPLDISEINEYDECLSLVNDDQLVCQCAVISIVCCLVANKVGLIS